MKRLILSSLFVAGSLCSEAQNYTILDTVTTEYCNLIWYVSGTDTTATGTYAPVEVSAAVRKNHKRKKFEKVQAKVVKVYPYARAAGDIMRAYDMMCQLETDPKKREQLLDQAEEELKRQFEADLRKMTVSEGVILIKLIDRETGNTSFTLLQELKGKFSAFMWQSVARLFGHDLKDDYDPEGEDVWIENTVLMIEDGVIPVELRKVDPFNWNRLAGR